jgi:ABC-type amino acid transport substrate-binding protein
LAGKTVAVGKGWVQEEFIAKRYPEIKLLPVNNIEQLLEAVSTGKAGAILEVESVAQYWIRKEGWTDLKTSGWARELDEGKSGSFHFYGQKNAPEVISILDNALATLPANELQALQNNGWAIPRSLARTERLPTCVPP